jgi:hypothetical protein
VTKYRAIPTEVEGIRFASRMEARRYQELRLMERAGEISNLKLQTRWPLVVNGVKVCEYRPDFEYDDARTAQHVVEDTKGAVTSVYRLKKKLMKAVHGVEILETTA